MMGTNIHGDSIRLAIFDVLGTTTPTQGGSDITSQTGASLANVGFSEYNEMASVQAEIWHPAGLVSIPALPNSTVSNQDSAQAIGFIRGDQNILFAYRDTRTELAAGKIQPGETCLYGSNSKAAMFIKSDDSITRLTEDSSGNLIMDELSPNGWKMVSPFGTAICDQTGWHFTHQSGAGMHLGGTTLNPIYPTFFNVNAASCTTNDMATQNIVSDLCLVIVNLLAELSAIGVTSGIPAGMAATITALAADLSNNPVYATTVAALLAAI
jgi:hypothetical protein